MKTKKMLIYVTFVCIPFILSAGCKGKTASASTDNNVLTKEQMIQRGDYLVSMSGCNDCHSPKKLGPKGSEIIADLMLSGYQATATLPPVDKKTIQNGWALLTLDLNAAAGPWGVSFAANLTSDQTGIGNWPEENFIRALKQGKFKGIEGGRTLLPPMPWQNFAKVSTDDIKAMFAYLKSTKPVRNTVPMPIEPADIK